MHHHETFWGNPRTWVGVAFVIFVVVFGRKIWAALSGILDGHANRIRAELEEASRLRREAEQMLHAAQKQRDEALEQSKRLIESAKAEAEHLREAAAREAEASAQRREQMAKDRISAAEKAAVDEVRLTAADIATKAAQAVIGQNLSPDADARLIDAAIAQLPAALAAKRAA